MTVPFVSMDAGNIRAQVQAVTRELDKFAARAVDAARQALDLAGEAMLADAQAAAPVQTGRLQESGSAEPVVLEGAELVKRWGFNLRYARMRDQGGTILPVKAKALAIPLSDEAKRLSSPREQEGRLRLVPLNGRLFLVERSPKGQGRAFQRSDLRHFHWMLVPKVQQKGNAYVSKTVLAWKDQLPRFVADRVGSAIGGGA
jgi:hypothetical protein